MLRKAPKSTGAANSVPNPASCKEISVADLLFRGLGVDSLGWVIIEMIFAQSKVS